MIGNVVFSRFNGFEWTMLFWRHCLDNVWNCSKSSNGVGPSHFIFCIKPVTTLISTPTPPSRPESLPSIHLSSIMVLPPPPKRAFKNVFKANRGQVYKPKARTNTNPQAPTRRWRAGSILLYNVANTSSILTWNQVLSIRCYRWRLHDYTSTFSTGNPRNFSGCQGQPGRRKSLCWRVSLGTGCSVCFADNVRTHPHHGLWNDVSSIVYHTNS